MAEQQTGIVIELEQDDTRPEPLTTPVDIVGTKTTATCPKDYMFMQVLSAHGSGQFTKLSHSLFEFLEVALGNAAMEELRERAKDANDPFTAKYFMRAANQLLEFFLPGVEDQLVQLGAELKLGAAVDGEDDDGDGGQPNRQQRRASQSKKPAAKTAAARKPATLPSPNGA